MTGIRTLNNFSDCIFNLKGDGLANVISDNVTFNQNKFNFETVNRNL